MNFYNPNKLFYCGIDLHARTIYICIMNKNRKVLVHRQIRNNSTDLFLKILQPYKHDLVIAAESTFAWYWLADFCVDNDINFVLGHALYMKTIHGGKAKNDRVDSKKITLLLQGGMFPLVVRNLAQSKRERQRSISSCIKAIKWIFKSKFMLRS